MKRLILLGILLLTGCAVVAPTPTSKPTATLVASENDEPLLLRTMVVQIEGRGDSLLSHIEETIDERGEPLTHTFVEIKDEMGHLWQGESLTYVKESLYFLQPLQSGGRTFIQVIAPLKTEVPARVLRTQTIEASNAPPPNATVDFVRAKPADDGTWSFDVTISHPDTGWDDYADGWHIETADGTILGTRVLLHPHENEQPFTRSLGGVLIGDDVDEVFVRSHDLVSGYSVEPLRVPFGEADSGERYEVMP